ncbi:MSCRAMM family protein [Methanopyrus sp.]
MEEPSKCLELASEIVKNPSSYGHPVVTITRLDWVNMIHASGLKTAEELEADHPEVVRLWREGMEVLKSIAPKLRELKGTELDWLVRDVVLRTVNEAQLSCMCEDEEIIPYLEVWKAELELLRDYLDGSASLMATSVSDGQRVLVFRYSDGGMAAVFLDRNWWCPSLGVVRGRITLDYVDSTELVVKGKLTSVGLDVTGGKIVVKDENGEKILEVPFTLSSLESGVTVRLPRDRRAHTVCVVLSGSVRGRLWDQFPTDDLTLSIQVPRADLSCELLPIEKTPEGATLEVRYRIHAVACTPTRLVVTLYDENGNIVGQKTIDNPPETGSVTFEVTGSGSYRVTLVLQCSSDLSTRPIVSELSTGLEIALPSVRVRASANVSSEPEGATLEVRYDVDASHAEVDGVEVILYDEAGNVVDRKEVRSPSGSVTFTVSKAGTYGILVVAHCRDVDTSTPFDVSNETSVGVILPGASVHANASVENARPEGVTLRVNYNVSTDHARVESVDVILYDETGREVGRRTVHSPSGSVTFNVNKSGTYKARVIAHCRSYINTPFDVSSETSMRVELLRVDIHVSTSVENATPWGATLRVHYNVSTDHAGVDYVEVILYDEAGHVVDEKTVRSPSSSITLHTNKSGTHKVRVIVHCKSYTNTSFDASIEMNVHITQSPSRSKQPSVKGGEAEDAHQSGVMSGTERRQSTANRPQEGRNRAISSTTKSETVSQRLRGISEEENAVRGRSASRKTDHRWSREARTVKRGTLQRRPVSSEELVKIATVELTVGRPFLVDVFEDGTVRVVELPSRVKSVDRITPTTLEITLQNGKKLYLTVDERGRPLPRKFVVIGSNTEGPHSREGTGHVPILPVIPISRRRR